MGVQGQQEANPDVAGGPDSNPARFPWRAGKARCLGGDEGRDQVQQRVMYEVVLFLAAHSDCKASRCGQLALLDAAGAQRLKVPDCFGLLSIAGCAFLSVAPLRSFYHSCTLATAK